MTLVKFIEKDNYDFLMKDIGITIMNHIRSQAFGNLTAQLSYGNPIFMNPKSNLYSFLISKGYAINSSASLSDLSDLNFSTFQRNVELINNHFGEKKVCERYEKLLSL